jgi:hypothetical protein
MLSDLPTGKGALMRGAQLVPFILTLILAAPVFAQQPISATTDSGRAVLLYADGTWKYKDVGKPTTPSPKLMSYTKSPTATEKLVLNQGKVIFNFDPGKWKQDLKPQEPGEHGFTHTSGDGYAKVICERLQIPLASLKEIALENARETAPNMHVVSEERRIVNGREVLCMQMRGTVREIPFVFLGYYYSGKEGSVQVITFTGDSLFDEYRKEFEEFINGFEIAK